MKRWCPSGTQYNPNRDRPKQPKNKRPPLHSPQPSRRLKSAKMAKIMSLKIQENSQNLFCLILIYFSPLFPLQSRLCEARPYMRLNELKTTKLGRDLASKQNHLWITVFDLLFICSRRERNKKFPFFFLFTKNGSTVHHYFSNTCPQFDLGHSFFFTFLYQFFDIFSHFFRLNRGSVSAIWLSLVVNKNLLKVPCYVVVFHRRPADLFHIVNEVIWNTASVL